MNKYADVGVALGTIADYIRDKGGSPIERDYHAVLRRIIVILEEHAKTDEAQARHHEEKMQDLARAYSRIADLEMKVQQMDAALRSLQSQRQ